VTEEATVILVPEPEHRVPVPPTVNPIAGNALTVAEVVPALLVQPPTVTVTEYVPVAAVVAPAIVGF
jgi:hypothetical protein